MTAVKLPIWYWAVAIVALIWNGLGVGAYFQQALMSPESLATLDPAQQEMFLNQPFWITAAFAVAVFAGFAGSILLLFRKKLAVRMFILSLVAVVVQYTGFFMEGYWSSLSGAAMVMPIMIPLFALGLVFFTRHFEARGVLT